MDKENPGTSHSNTPHKWRKTSDESTKSIGVINLLEENRIMKDHCELTAEALSNVLVLQNIFRNLNGEDLESCKLVNQRWNFVLGQTYSRHFQVTIKPAVEHPNPGCEKEFTEQNLVTIQKLWWSSKHSNKKKFSFPDAVALLLEESSKERKFAIDLAIEIPSRAVPEHIVDFLSTIGHLVEEFTPYSRMEFLDPLCRLSQQHFPNLCFLNLSHGSIEFFGGTSWEHCNEFLRDNSLRNLKKICFGQSLEHFESPDRFMRVTESLKATESLIKMAPNLKEIHEFPVHLVDALISTGKRNLVKSICYPIYRLIGEPVADEHNEDYIFQIGNGGPLEVALQKFALLDPKLISFNFELSCEDSWETFLYSYPFTYFYNEYLKHSICRILQSSHQSLKTLTMHPFASFDFQDISPITSLKKIRSIYSQGFVDYESFTTNVNLERVFPNVVALEIDMNLLEHTEKRISMRLLSPWGSNIKELVLAKWFFLDSDAILLLAQTFPSITSFNYLGPRPLLPDTFMDIFPFIAWLWPRMEIITVKLTDQRKNYHGYSFDAMFTGIPKRSITRLRTPRGRRIPKKKIEAFYEDSTVRQLSYLKRLEVDFHCYSVSERKKFLDKLYTITSVSKQFGFDFLPPTFTILIRERGYPSIFEVPRDLKKIQEDLSSVVALEFETIKEERIMY